MRDQRETIERISASPYKIVGLITSVFTILACFVGAVTWVSVNMANNAVAIETLEREHRRYEVLIAENSKIIGQHAQLLAILKTHSEKINRFEDFMTKGGRFTENDGRKLKADIDEIRERLMHYQVLEAELRWIKKSLQDITKQMEVVAQKQDKVYEMHRGFPHEGHNGG